jgi:anti-anti-sigma factor
MAALLTATGSWFDRRYVVEAEGEIDVFTCPILVDALRGCSGRRLDLLEIDLTRVDFVDSTGVACLLQWFEDCRERGAEFAVRRGPSVQRVLDVVGWSVPEPADAAGR